MVIKVGIIEKKPFIINKDKISGFTIDIWENIAKKHNITYKYYTIPKDENIDDVIESNKYDIILGVIGLTPERVRKIDFTVPYYFTHFSLVNKKRDEKKKIYEDMAKYTMLLFSYILLSMFIYYILHSKENVKINEIIYNTLKNMSPITFSQKDTDFHSRINYFFGWFFVILLFIGIYNRFFNNSKTEDIIKKPILVDSKNTMLIKYLKSRGAKVKVVNNSGGLNNLLDL